MRKNILWLLFLTMGIIMLGSCSANEAGTDNNGVIDDAAANPTISPVTPAAAEPTNTSEGDTVKKEEETIHEESKAQIPSPTVYGIKEPQAGNYPQGLYRYPYKQNYLSDELFLQTLEWSPKVEKTYEIDTEYTAILTLTPVAAFYTFKGLDIKEVKGLPTENVSEISTALDGDNMVIRIVFNKTAAAKVEQTLLFSDEFEADILDETKWAICPSWDRQGRSTWVEDMVSVDGGYLHLKLKRDTALGESKTDDTALANNWIASGAIRTSTKNRKIIFENNFGYYEARIKFPKIQGTWGAFWLMSPTQGILTDDAVIGTEIDIIESIANPKGKYNAALHWDGYGDEHKSVGSGDVSLPDIDIYDGEFHVFALDWSPNEYIFYVDGIAIWRCDGGADFKNCGINQNPNYIKLSVEGAAYAGVLPADFEEDEMLVDYVRVYSQPLEVE